VPEELLADELLLLDDEPIIPPVPPVPEELLALLDEELLLDDELVPPMPELELELDVLPPVPTFSPDWQARKSDPKSNVIPIDARCRMLPSLLAPGPTRGATAPQ
jgi:hypothetical protein